MQLVARRMVKALLHYENEEADRLNLMRHLLI